MVRRVAYWAIVFGLGSATAAAAQTLAPQPSAADALAGAAFLDRETYVPDRGPARWRSGEVQLSSGKRASTSLRINMAEVRRTPAGLPLNLDRAAYDVDTDALDVTLIRSWPGAVNFAEGGLEFDVSPHAGVGVGTGGGQAEAGAMLTVGQKRERQAVEALKDMGVRDGLEYGGKGRWYLFAAASGRAVGLNMMRNEGAWDRGGWSTDTTGALIGDAHVGVGWRKGDVQSSLGVIHREVKGQHMVFGQHTREDTVAAFTFSIRPQR